MTDQRHDHGSPECRKIFERLSEFLDGELPPDLCSTIDGHMDDCPPCQQFLDALRKTVKLIERVDAPVLPEEIRHRVREAYRRFENRR